MEGDGTLMAVRVSTEGGFPAGPATRLFQHASLRPGYPQYDVSASGRFVLPGPVNGANARPVIRVVENWFAKFDRKD